MKLFLTLKGVCEKFVFERNRRKIYIRTKKKTKQTFIFGHYTKSREKKSVAACLKWHCIFVVGKIIHDKKVSVVFFSSVAYWLVLCGTQQLITLFGVQFWSDSMPFERWCFYQLFSSTAIFVIESLNVTKKQSNVVKDHNVLSSSKYIPYYIESTTSPILNQTKCCWTNWKINKIIVTFATCNKLCTQHN